MMMDDENTEYFESEEIAPLYLFQYFIQSRGDKYFSEWLSDLDNDTLDYLTREMEFLTSVPEHFFTTDRNSLSKTAEDRIADVVNLINAALAHDACLVVTGKKKSELEVILEVCEKIEPDETKEIFDRVFVIVSAIKMCRLGLLKPTKNEHCTIEKYNPEWTVTKIAKQLSYSPKTKSKPKAKKKRK